MLIISTIFFILMGVIIGYFLAKFTLQPSESQTAGHRSKISSRYLIIISATAIAFTLCWILLPTQKALLGMIFVSYLICVATIDIEQLIIPNSLTFFGFLFALLFSILFPILHNPTNNLTALRATESILSALTGSFAGSGCLLWIAIIAEAIIDKEPLGMGDVKLMGALGTFCGWKGALFAIFGGSLLASLLILPYQFIKRSCSKDTATFNQHIPFGFWLALASFLYFIWFQQPFEEHLQGIIDIYSTPKFL